MPINITIEDIKRIKLAEGETLLVRLPPDTPVDICQTAQRIFAEALQIQSERILVVNVPLELEAITVQ